MIDSGTKCAWVIHESKAVQIHLHHSNRRCLYVPRVPGSVKNPHNNNNIARTTTKQELAGWSSGYWLVYLTFKREIVGSNPARVETIFRSLVRLAGFP